MSDVFGLYDVMILIIEGCPIYTWTRIARVCKLWYAIVKEKRDRLPFEYLIDVKQMDRVIRVNHQEYMLPAYNQFSESFTTSVQKSGKSIVSHFLFAGFECQLDIPISESDMLYNIIPDCRNFSNKTLLKLADFMYMQHIEKYIHLQDLLAEKIELRLIMEGQEYYSFHFNKRLYYFDKEADSRQYGLFNLVMIYLLSAKK